MCEIVKLPAPCVDELIDASRAHLFAPAGRRSRQWAAIAPDRPDVWPALTADQLPS